MYFETAQPRDLAAVAALVNNGYRGEGSRAGWTTEADLFNGERTNPNALAEDLEATTGRLMLTMRETPGSPIVGCVYLDTRVAPGKCYLGMLTVQPGDQARGLGRALLNAAEQKARDTGAERMRLCVLSPRDELMAWYERRGYRRTGETKPFPYEKAHAERPTRGDLEFVFFEKALAAPQTGSPENH
jgi:ribosomal protein S18 acetylase RimI-like enzyme